MFLKKFTVDMFDQPRGAFKNYVDRRGWVGGQSNVYVSKLVSVNKLSTRGG